MEEFKIDFNSVSKVMGDINRRIYGINPYAKMNTMNDMLEEQGRLKANPDCPHCEGTGTVYEADGPDDVLSVPCNCLKKYEGN